MIYGLNFNGTAIPEGVAKKFPKTLKKQCQSCEGAGGYPAEDGGQSVPCRFCTPYGRKKGSGKVTYELKGVGQNEQERDAMLAQANNGHRQLHAEPRQTVNGIWWGIYVG